MIKLTTITLIALTVPIYANAAIIQLDNGELCINSATCKSGVCKQIGTNSSGGNITACVPKAPQGEECSAQTQYGIYYNAPCARGLTCTQVPVDADTSTCVDTESSECPSCNAWVRNDYFADDDYPGYTVYMHGKCGDKCSYESGWETAFRCANGYYGISNSDVITTPTGCKKCPEHGSCPEGYNETFYCAQGYYKSGDSCIRCPLVGTNSDGTEVYGTTEFNIFGDAITRCYVSAGTYTDTTGTFELSDQCSYTE